MFELYPDASKALANAKEHQFKTAVVTTIARFKFENALLPVRRYIDVVMDGYEAGCEKTNPKMYKKTLEALKVAPSEAVMIGDDLEIDVMLPKKLGIHAILLDREGKTQGSTPADAIAKDLNEAIEKIEVVALTT